jgi:hypothetical protein
MAHSQVRLFLAAPAGRQTHLRLPGRESLPDFDHPKPNDVRPFAIAKYGLGVESEMARRSRSIFSKTDQY